MNCPKCGYAMTDLDVECPRCKRMPQQQAAPPPVAPPPQMPPVQPGPVLPDKQGKPAPVVLAVPPRSGVLTWVLVGVGVAIVALLVALLWTQLRKPVNSGQLAEKPTESQSPAQSQGEGLAAGGQTTQQSATGAGGVAQGQSTIVPPAGSEAGNLAEAQKKNVPPATGAGNLAEGQQQNVPPATGAGGLAEGEEEDFDPRTVCSWREVYRIADTSGQGSFVTPPLTLQRPWRIRYYTGHSVDYPVSQFMVYIGNDPMKNPAAVAMQYQAEVQNFAYGKKTGTFPLSVMATFTGWVLAVDQGEFCKR